MRANMRDSFLKNRPEYFIVKIAFSVSTMAVLLSGCDSTSQMNTKQTAAPQWQLVWQDEFSDPQIDQLKWSYELNCYGGGNNENQCYTKQDKNAFIEEGILKIVAIKENFTGPDAHDDAKEYNINNTKIQPYTSARLRTKGKGDWKYGRFEISAKLPAGQGTWPAIWMLPTDWAYGGWAGSGEIDIMEAVNLKAKSDEGGKLTDEPESRIHGTLHYGKAWPNNVYSGMGYRLPNNVNPADGFHEYAVEWEEGEIRWYVDKVHFATQTKEGWYTQYMSDDNVLVNGTGSAPFDQKFHLLLNFAVGGDWAGNVNEKGVDESVFPQSLEVDYVRVYKCSIESVTGKGCATIDPIAKLVTGKAAPAL